jgi:hypothetical protein
MCCPGLSVCPLAVADADAVSVLCVYRLYDYDSCVEAQLKIWLAKHVLSRNNPGGPQRLQNLLCKGVNCRAVACFTSTSRVWQVGDLRLRQRPTRLRACPALPARACLPVCLPACPVCLPASAGSDMFSSSAKRPAYHSKGKGLYWQTLGPYTCSMGEAGGCAVCTDSAVVLFGDFLHQPQAAA